MVYEVFESILSSEKLAAQGLHKRRRLFNTNLSKVSGALQVDPASLPSCRIRCEEKIKHRASASRIAVSA